jgi:hypothetical protein
VALPILLRRSFEPQPSDSEQAEIGKAEQVLELVKDALSPDSDWPTLNRERGELIDRKIAGQQFNELRLAYLNGYADARIQPFQSVPLPPEMEEPRGPRFSNPDAMADWVAANLTPPDTVTVTLSTAIWKEILDADFGDDATNLAIRKTEAR